jgi:MFS superfamily sulfate permease-like transporter
MGTTKSERLHLLSFTTDLLGSRAAADIEAFVGGVPSCSAVVIDLMRVHDIDLQAVTALQRSAVACQARSVVLAVAVHAERVRLALERGGVDQLAPVVATVEDAVRSLGGPLPS